MNSDISCFFFSNVKIDVTHGKLENNKKIQFWTKCVWKPVLCNDREDEKACKEYGDNFLDKGASKPAFSLGNGGFVECLFFVVFWHYVLKSVMQVLPDAKIYNTHIKLKYQCATEQ